MYRKKQMLLKWKDKKDITMISSIHDETEELVKGRGGMVERPSVIVDYNANMGGVYLADNYLHFYRYTL
jgi:hypothetical protein